MPVTCSLDVHGVVVAPMFFLIVSLSILCRRCCSLIPVGAQTNGRHGSDPYIASNHLEPDSHRTVPGSNSRRRSARERSIAAPSSKLSPPTKVKMGPPASEASPPASPKQATPVMTVLAYLLITGGKPGITNMRARGFYCRVGSGVEIRAR